MAAGLCLAGHRAEVTARVAAAPDLVQRVLAARPEILHTAVKRGAFDAAQLLLDLGVRLLVDAGQDI